MTVASCESSVTQLVDFYEHLTPASLSRLGDLYAAQARFKDPFNDVRGLPAIAGVFTHMFDKLDKPRFVVTARIVQGEQCFLAWNFEYRFRTGDKPAQQTIRGGSHLVFDARGRVESHRDYWDAAEELYEKMPVLGGLMRWLKKRASTAR